MILASLQDICAAEEEGKGKGKEGGSLGEAAPRTRAEELSNEESHGYEPLASTDVLAMRALWAVLQRSDNVSVGCMGMGNGNGREELERGWMARMGADYPG